VLFTADPVTGRRRQAVIDASPGLGEAVVSGAVNPDRFVVDTATGTILERHLGDKKVVVRALPDGGVTYTTAVDATALACVTDDQAPDDIFMLTTAEARSGLAGTDLHGLVDARRKAYDTELRRRRVPRVLLSDGTEPEATAVPAVAPDGSLMGTAASAGTITGSARVIPDPVGAYLEPGEILVAPSTDSGWTPLFLTAGGLVMEMGGANSHGAVVAREYGIPAVVGVPDATTRITTGDEITVDGVTGTVLPA
jgi:phosphoenolpyruvate synthase/pyruvate phosphate dikinase